ncbi:MAG: hypothetical protein QW478_02175 [Candidatus Micrarchaeaceae archaeon]
MVTFWKPIDSHTHSHKRLPLLGKTLLGDTRQLPYPSLNWSHEFFFWILAGVLMILPLEFFFWRGRYYYKKFGRKNKRGIPHIQRKKS